MRNVTVDDLLKIVSTYNEEEVGIIRRAYEYADYLHNGQI